MMSMNMFKKFVNKVVDFFSTVTENIKNKYKERAEFIKRNKELKKRLQKKRKIKRHKLKFYLERAGITVDTKRIAKYIFNTCVLINLLLSAWLIYFFSTGYGYTLGFVLIVMVVVWVLIFLLLLFVLGLLFHIFLDIRIFQRKVTIEEVLPDYLLLTSANIRSGMPIDKALWYAVRPRFGVLAKEIETVAKQTMSGEDLEVALQNFADKYDSMVLKRAVNLLVEGIQAGGEIGDLLNKISLNIQESQILKKEMAANVTSYAIFITFATVVGAPFLFGLSYQLLNVITKVMAEVNVPMSTSVMGMSIGSFHIGITQSDFRLFAILSLTVTSFFSSIIIATIRKGNVKAGLKYIPMFMIGTILLFLIASHFMGIIFSSLI